MRKREIIIQIGQAQKFIEKHLVAGEMRSKVLKHLKKVREMTEAPFSDTDKLRLIAGRLMDIVDTAMRKNDLEILKRGEKKVEEDLKQMLH